MNEAERALAELIEAVRGPLGGIRAAIETLNRYPDMDPTVAAQLHALVEAQAVALSAVIEAAEANAARRARRPLVPVPAAELLGHLSTALAGLPVDVVPEARQRVLHADPPALAAAVRALAELVENAARPDRLSLALTERGVMLGWKGSPIRPERLARWLDHPLPGLPEPATIGGVVDHHGGVTSGGEGGEASLTLALREAA